MSEQGRRITVVDDHAETRQLLADILEVDGHAVTLRESVDPQVHALRDSSPDLVIVDLLLSTDPADREVEREAGTMRDVALLAKPFGVDELRSAVASLTAVKPRSREAVPADLSPAEMGRRDTTRELQA